VPAVVNYAVDADQVFASDTIVPHQLLGVARAEVGFLDELLLLHRIVEGYEVFWELLGFEWFLKGSSANGAESKFLLLNLDEALLAESVTAVEVPGDSGVCVEIFVARRALHVFCG